MCPSSTSNLGPQNVAIVHVHNIMSCDMPPLVVLGVLVLHLYLACKFFKQAEILIVTENRTL